MRASTGGHAVVLPCPQCARTWSTEQTLAGHLMDTHEMDASPAVARAIQVAHEIMDKRHPKVGAQTDEGDAHEPPADGVPARVGRLRAYGNAIVPQVAATFVRAYMEARGR